MSLHLCEKERIFECTNYRPLTAFSPDFAKSVIFLELKSCFFVENNKKYFSKIMKILLQLVDINKIKKNKKYF